MFDLIVTQPFGERAKGDRISDPAHVAEILDSSQRHHVVKVAARAAEPVQAHVADADAPAPGPPGEFDAADPHEAAKPHSA